MTGPRRGNRYMVLCPRGSSGRRKMENAVKRPVLGMLCPPNTDMEFCFNCLHHWQHMSVTKCRQILGHPPALYIYLVYNNSSSMFFMSRQSACLSARYIHCVVSSTICFMVCNPRDVSRIICVTSTRGLPCAICQVSRLGNMNIS